MVRVAFERGNDIRNHLIGGEFGILDSFTAQKVPRIIPAKLANCFALFRCTVEVHKIHAHGDTSPHSASHFGLAPLHWLGGARVHSLMLFMHDVTHGDHGFSVSETMQPGTIAAQTSATKNLIIENLLYFVEMKHIRIGARALHFDRVVATRKW